MEAEAQCAELVSLGLVDGTGIDYALTPGPPPRWQGRS